MSIAIIGGGPSGALCALTLARAGFAIDVYEKRPDFRIEERLEDEAAALAAANAVTTSSSSSSLSMAASSSSDGGLGGSLDTTSSTAAASAAFGQSRDAVKRSINLALSHRGQEALRSVGLLDAVMERVVPMPCRALHLSSEINSKQGGRGGSEGSTRLVTQMYGRPGQAIYSVSRAFVNRVLLDELDRLAPAVKVHFESNVVKLEDKGAGKGGVQLTVKLSDGSERTYEPLLIVGADGAYSFIRGAMLRFSRMNYARTFIDHGYKELTIPASVTGDYALPTPHALHIWPRKKFMMIALPNPDRSFTCTLFMPYATFDALEGRPCADPDDVQISENYAAGSGGVRAFFERNFADTLALLPGLENQFSTNPTSSLVEIRCDPWNVRDKVLLIGDAAHGTVPFYGQGMNAALEDCLCLSEALAAEGGNLSKAVVRFAKERQPAGIALCDLSMANYDEMKDKTASRWFLIRKELEGWLNWLLPTYWVPQYSMVAFSRIPYHHVIERAKTNDKILDWALFGFGLAGLTATVIAGRIVMNRFRL
jgi:kynurenine 3-monooxygenase